MLARFSAELLFDRVFSYILESLTSSFIVCFVSGIGTLVARVGGSDGWFHLVCYAMLVSHRPFPPRLRAFPAQTWVARKMQEAARCKMLCLVLLRWRVALNFL